MKCRASDLFWDCTHSKNGGKMGCACYSGNDGCAPPLGGAAIIPGMAQQPRTEGAALKSGGSRSRSGFDPGMLKIEPGSVNHCTKEQKAAI